MPPHVGHLARKKLAKSNDFIGPRNYQYWIGQNPPPEKVEAFKRGIEYASKSPVVGYVKGKP